MNGMNLECILGSIVVVVCIKQCSDSGSARASRSGEVILVLGDRPSRLGECASPKRELACVLCGLVAPLAQARFIVLSEGTSRSSESLSPKRDFECGPAVSLNSSPRRGSLILGE